ncbi:MULTISPECIES: hypothetical protein [Acinetobacter calcoaceticus/baumannii complex]|uniref:hypothetical protein n=1 Tax=Acinetobacter calcoaceticus/baumannii complex TaxID=909768 RepID=UPI00135FCA49|nr:hypothetical protein [Acinetobacter baumannii]MDC5505994.1 hypothetical protein [Acinetobacter baumannii]UAA84182.1 hypothetical protein H2787_12860 [Acinetobacter baumannii]CAA0222957.1 hypothetical protein ABKPCSM17A_01982 [Acinetobacter baumannii]HEN9571379.1 hypothetical protein [Acinetobacter baumannii]
MLIPRRIILHNPKDYRDYHLNSKYSYDKKQLDKIINALEYYKELAILENHNYVVFSFTVYPNKKSKFNVADLKSIFPVDQYFYRWTREYKDLYQVGEHYHLMVIANNTNNTRCFDLRNEIATLKGVKACYFAPRKGHLENSFFHNLSYESEDAVSRYCYYSKIDQKQNITTRSYDGSRNLKPLKPVKSYDTNLWRKAQVLNQNNEIVSQNKTKQDMIFNHATINQKQENF